MARINHQHKPFKKRKSLVKLLAGRNLQINRRDKTFKKYSYYYLINGYSSVFIHNVNNTIPDYTGASIDYFVRMEEFDFEIRTRVLKEILRIENRVKNHVFYVFASYHGDQDYLIPSNFDTFGKINKKKNVYALLSKLNNKIAQNCNTDSSRNHAAFNHYITQHNNIPPWVLKLELTLGELSKFYSNLQSPVRQTIAKEYKVQENVLGTLLYFLSQVRNKCAHNERIYDAKLITKLPINPYHTHFNIQKRNNFFAVLIALKFLMTAEEYKKFIEYIDTQLTELKQGIPTAYVNSILTIMGIPSNWKDVCTI
ncbi:Abi family protein [Planococcus sp. YIM B11945]|uniref:Abi family protein n=1 Tax=Planococcus sp. YIM B11945 TaxID=3435410 RepID=UPI003D7EC530